MIKLYKARSLLYRRQILQENIRWKALDEIYKIYMFLHRSDLNISEKNRHIILHFVANVARFRFFKKLVEQFQNLPKIAKIFRNGNPHRSRRVLRACYAREF